MKKILSIIILTAFSFMVCQTTLAKEYEKIKVSFGMKGGKTWARFGGSDAVLRLGPLYPSMTPEFHRGFSFGGFIEFKFDKTFSIQPELYYVTKGNVYDIKIYKIDYLEMPVLLKCTSPSKGLIRPYGFGGVSGAIKISAVGKNGYFTQKEKATDTYKNYDLGILVGGGFNIKAGSGLLCIDARYSLGFIKLSKSGSPDWINEVVSILMGYSM
jgi:hypothetical protein